MPRNAMPGETSMLTLEGLLMGDLIGIAVASLLSLVSFMFPDSPPFPSRDLLVHPDLSIPVIPGCSRRGILNPASCHKKTLYSKGI
jgi:hypothetical protein